MEVREAFGALRPICPNCRFVHFHDPKVAAGVLVIDAGKVLLVRRVMEPERGKWSLPAGFVDGDEDPRATAARECLEETGLVVEITGLIDVYPSREHIRGASIVIVYRGQVTGGALEARDDADQAGWFRADELPPLAFASTKTVIEQWGKDL
jgi:ADP-ribose pyrophosphatase YjhB (NUDIX family)